MYQKNDQQYVKCENCHQKISINSIWTHEIYCKRYKKRCQQCNQMIDVKDKLFHIHNYKNSKQKQIYCNYCQLNVPQDKFDAHVKFCQSHTQICQKCKLYVSKKKMQTHLVDCVQLLKNKQIISNDYKKKLKCEQNQKNKDRNLVIIQTKKQLNIQSKQISQPNKSIQKQQFLKPLKIQNQNQKDKIQNKQQLNSQFIYRQYKQPKLNVNGDVNMYNIVFFDTQKKMNQKQKLVINKKNAQKYDYKMQLYQTIRAAIKTQLEKQKIFQQQLRRQKNMIMR